MEVLAKGQLSYMILSCLSERDMYGLELVDEIKKKYGREIKLPSLYSNINRMKELKYISSYLKESSKGPKCSYSSITEAGRKALANLEVEFGGLSKVKEISQKETKEAEDEIAKPKQENDFENYLTQSNAYYSPNNENLVDDYDEYFNLTEEDNQEEKKNNIDIEELKTEEDKADNELSKDELSNENDFDSVIEEKTEVKIETNTQQNQNNITETNEQYNQRLYSASRDFSKNRNKRSYTENQLQLAISPAPAKSYDRQAQDLSELKSALLQSKEANYQKAQEEFKIFNSLKSVEEEKEHKTPAIVDDGAFITERLPEEAIPKPKKIEPPRLNITLSTPGYDKKLPAPKRNVSVDPNCSDVRAKIESLYAKAETKKESVVEVNEEFENYEDLSNYYQSQGVDFKIYERPESRIRHNTNLLNLFVSLFIFGLIGVGSAIFYLIFSLAKMTTDATNFVYYLFPIVALVYVVYSYYTYKTTVSKIPSQMWHPAIVWSLFALFIALIFLINFACGVSFTDPVTYFSTILFPIYVSGCATVGTYYSQIYVYKKYWK